MKIKGKVWMDWLHQVREETLEERKREGRTLSQHLRIIEGREGHPEAKGVTPLRKKKK
jgi:hypothetical protein